MREEQGNTKRKNKGGERYKSTRKRMKEMLKGKGDLKIRRSLKKQKLEERGITLIALVVTIIILLILTGVTLNMALGQNGLFSRAKNAVDKYKKAQDDEIKMLEELERMLVRNSTNNNPTVTPTVTPTATPTQNPPEKLSISLDKADEFIIQDKTTEIKATVMPSGKTVKWTSSDDEIANVTNGTVIGKQVGRVTITATIEGTDTKATCLVRVAAKENKTLQDGNNNPYVVPGYFTIVPDGLDDKGYPQGKYEKPNVQNGIVIEDEDRNQFVWIPVSNIDGDNKKTGNESNLIAKSSEETVKITLRKVRIY